MRWSSVEVAAMVSCGFLPHLRQNQEPSHIEKVHSSADAVVPDYELDEGELQEWQELERMRKAVDPIRQTSRKRKSSQAKPKMPINFEEDTWTALKSSIDCIFLKQPAPCDTENLSQDVRDLCLFERGGSLYELIQEQCQLHIATGLEQVVGKSQDMLVFLPLVEKHWMEFCDHMISICGITLHLDILYVKRTPTARSVWDLGLMLFRKHFSLSAGLEHKVVTEILKLIENERIGEAIDMTMLKNLLGMFSVLEIYKESFEHIFLECTHVFYSRERAQYMQRLNVPDYLQHVELRLLEENERCSHYLAERTRMPLISTASKQLLEFSIPEILGKGFKTLMNGNCVDDLRRMYALFLKINSVNLMDRELSSYTKSIGGRIIMDEENEDRIVASLIELKAVVDRIWETSFLRNEAFARTIKDAFKHVVNLRQNKLAELLAKFLDENLRSGNKGASEEELEGVLSNVLILFKYLEAKDIFKSYYKKQLSKRLLRRCASLDAEKSIILKLKTECGSTYTSCFEMMLKDIQLSEEINDSFRLSSQARTRLPTGMEISVDVLTSSSWPTYPPTDLQLPRELAVYQDAFKEFYLSKFKGRRLSWSHSLGHCVLQARFADGIKELEVSLFQAVLLMLFNDSPMLSFQDLKVASGIADKELRRTLHSLACGKICILKKISSGSTINDEDSFMINEEFNSPSFRIKVNAVQLKEMGEEKKNTSERVLAASRFQVEAAIIRIMKAKKTISHTDLIIQILDQFKLNIKIADLKRWIENLIDREFLIRDKRNPELYKYLA